MYPHWSTKRRTRRHQSWQFRRRKIIWQIWQIWWWRWVWKLL